MAMLKNIFYIKGITAISMIQSSCVLHSYRVATCNNLPE